MICVTDEALNRDLDLVNKWLISTQLALNTIKTEIEYIFKDPTSYLFTK